MRVEESEREREAEWELEGRERERERASGQMYHIHNSIHILCCREEGRERGRGELGESAQTNPTERGKHSK